LFCFVLELGLAALGAGREAGSLRQSACSGVVCL